MLIFVRHMLLQKLFWSV